MNLLYCIMCEHTEYVEDEFHTYSVYMYPDTPELYGCTGPFSYCPPPEMTEELWEILFSNEPSMDELEQINQNDC